MPTTYRSEQGMGKEMVCYVLLAFYPSIDQRACMAIKIVL